MRIGRGNLHEHDIERHGAGLKEILDLAKEDGCIVGAAGGYEAGLACFDSLQLFKRLLNLGDAKSLAIHPASTTHRQLSKDELVAAGIRPETIRLSIGLEHVDDLIDDIDQALTKAMA